MCPERLHEDVLAGATDVHVHTAPDLIERYESDLELAREAVTANMRAVVVKSHVVPTVGRVDLINEALGEDILYGGIALNGSVGGINPDAAETALQLGAKIVWLPTAWSANHAHQARDAGVEQFVGQRVPTATEDISVTKNGRVTDATREVIDLVGEYDAVLGTGHISPDEIEVVVDACADAGTRCLINHPFFRIVDLPLDRQIDLANRGAVLEYCAYSLESTPGHELEDIVAAVERIGPEHCLLATDFGQATNPPISGFAQYIRDIRAAGVSEADILQMISETPARLLGL